MKTTYPHVHVVGNIGIPYTGLVAEDTDDTVTVAEISSFQLETIDTFCPEVSAILNITPDHLNRHHTMDNYIAAKMSIAKNQGPEQTCVLNYEDEVLKEQAKHLSAKVVFFSSLSKLEEGFYLEGDKIVYAHDGQIEEVISTDELNILGRHNHENAMAATAMAMSYGVPVKIFARHCVHSRPLNTESSMSQKNVVSVSTMIPRGRIRMLPSKVFRRWIVRLV